MITGPSGVGKGTLIRGCASASPSSSSRSRRRRGRRGPGRRTGATTTSSTARSSTAAPTRTTSSSTPPTAATATGRCAPRSSGGSHAGESVVLEIEVQGARQVRAAMPEAVQVFIAPPDPAALRERLEGRGTDDPEAIDERLRTAERELAAQEEFQHVVVNDELDARPPTRDLEARSCGRRARHWHSSRASRRVDSPTLRADDQAPRRQTARAHRLPLRRGGRRREARPPDQQLLPRPRRGQLRGVHRRRWSRARPATT